ncbi:MAG: VWA domain-containing protein [Nanoarchaeota archaeon]|mgnify:CR=1 FL=1
MNNKEVLFDTQQTNVKHLAKAEETKGALKSQLDEDKLMRSVLANDKQTIEQGRLLGEMLNLGIHSFTPEITFSQIVKNYQAAQNLYGEKLLRFLSGYDPQYLKRNINIPEFQRELQIAITKQIESLKETGLLNQSGSITDTGITIASYLMYIDELDHLIPKGIHGERIHKRTSQHGDPLHTRIYHKGDRYKDIDIKASITAAIRRRHRMISIDDLYTSKRQSKGSIYVIYGLDASGSMKGEKIGVAKKAGIALAHTAILQRDKVGLITFGTNIKETVAPTTDLHKLIRSIACVTASKQTDFPNMIKKAIEMFPITTATKHLILLTDALPTIGVHPEEETLKSIAQAMAQGITTSLIGIKLNTKGRAFAQRIIEVGKGRLFHVKNLDTIDRLIIEDYHTLW